MSTPSGADATPQVWSPCPGAYEAHLIRRHNNPYFQPERRSISLIELTEAQQRDNDNYISCQQQLEHIEQLFKGLLACTDVTTGNLLDLRERVDNLIYFSIEVGGFGERIAQRAQVLRNAVIEMLKTAFLSDEEHLNKIRAAETYHQYVLRTYYLPVIAQLRRKSDPISHEELLPTLLSSDPLTIFTWVIALPSDIRNSIQLEAIRIMVSVLNDGFKDPQFDEKLEAIIKAGKWLGTNSDNSC